MDSSQLPNLIYLIIFLATLIFSVVVKGNLKFSILLKYSTIWLIFALITLTIYSFRYNFYEIKNRVVAELFPSKANKLDSNKIVVMSSNDGHFYIDININRKPVHFMVDTGASDIILNQEDAESAGIDVANLNSFRRYQTANGMVTNGLAMVDELELSGIKFYKVAVTVNSGDIGISLLGMSFLKKFKKYEFYQDRMILTY